MSTDIYSNRSAISIKSYEDRQEKSHDRGRRKSLKSHETYYIVYSTANHTQIF